MLYTPLTSYAYNIIVHLHNFIAPPRSNYHVLSKLAYFLFELRVFTMRSRMSKKPSLLQPLLNCVTRENYPGAIQFSQFQ